MRMRMREDAYTLEAVVEAGVPPSTARLLLADGPRAVPERALVSATGRKRTSEPTTKYVWWPDAINLLTDMAMNGMICPECLSKDCGHERAAAKPRGGR